MGGELFFCGMTLSRLAGCCLVTQHLSPGDYQSISSSGAIGNWLFMNISAGLALAYPCLACRSSFAAMVVRMVHASPRLLQVVQVSPLGRAFGAFSRSSPSQ